jgi:hypothetical protein
MDLRILKKKSNQSASIIARHYEARQDTFIAERGESYHGLKIRYGHLRHKPRFTCQCQYHPLKGTPMFGGMSGYYEPEWEERTAFGELCELVMWGDRAGSMTDSEWERVLKITGVTPVDLVELRQWAEAA